MSFHPPGPLAELHPLQRATQHHLSHLQPSQRRLLRCPPCSRPPSNHHVLVSSYRFQHCGSDDSLFSPLISCCAGSSKSSLRLTPRPGPTDPGAAPGAPLAAPADTSATSGSALGSGSAIYAFPSSPVQTTASRFFRASIRALPSSSPSNNSIMLCLQASACGVLVRPLVQPSRTCDESVSVEATPPSASRQDGPPNRLSSCNQTF